MTTEQIINARKYYIENKVVSEAEWDKLYKDGNTNIQISCDHCGKITKIEDIHAVEVGEQYICDVCDDCWYHCSNKQIADNMAAKELK